MRLFLVFSVLALFSYTAIPAYAEVVIIEVESNPEGEDAGSEWALLFNSADKQVSLTGWGIIALTLLLPGASFWFLRKKRNTS